MKLKISNDLQLPSDAAGQTFALLARRGAGKTYAAKVLAEEMLETKTPIVVLDPTGVWWGMRSSADGKVAGYPVVIMGGNHGDVPLEPGSGKVIADFLVSERVPTILDLSRMGEAEMQQFVADLAERFYRTNSEAVHWFVDEADEFAPQDARGGGPLWKCLGAMQRIVRRGRVKGIGCTLITQRSAVLNKSVLTQTECLIAMQNTAPQDMDAIEAWLKYQAPKEERSTIMSQLPKLQQGEALVYSPAWLGVLRKIKIRRLRTFDSSRTPKPGESKREPKRLADVDLKALEKQVAATIERAKADDPKELRKRIAELEREKKSQKPAADEAALKKAFDQGKAESDREWRAQFQELQGKHTKCVGKLNRIHDLSTLNGEAEPVDIPQRNITQNRPNITQPARVITQSTSRPAAARRREPAADADGALGKGELAILTAVAQFDGVSTNQLVTLTGYKRSSRDTYIQRLREKGFVDKSGDRILPTEEGVAALGRDFEPLPTGEDLQRYWLEGNRLGEGERAILQFLIERYPNFVPRGDIDDATGYKRSSRDTYLQRLKSRCLVVSQGGDVGAADALFNV